MKKLLSLSKAGFVLLTLLFAWSAAGAGSFHVIVGSFSESFAAWNVANAVEKNFARVQVRYDEDLKVHHLSVFESHRYDEAKAFRDRLEREKGFCNAWIYAVVEGGEVSSGVGGVDGPVSMELYTGGTIFLSSTDNSYLGVTNGKMQKDAHSEAASVPFTFAGRTSNGIAIPGRVALIDSRGETVHAVTTGKIVNFTGQYQDKAFTVIFHAPGYSPTARVIHPGALRRTSDVHQNEEGAWEVPVRAEKLSVDMMTMLFTDLFHSEAAILRSDRREVINLLIAIVKSRRARGIEIDAHSDGDEKRTVLLPRGGGYFDISSGAEKTVSGKQLTKERAEGLAGYLVSQGIDRNRVEALGWGGIDPIIKGSEVDTGANERVEIRLFFNGKKRG